MNEAGPLSERSLEQPLPIRRVSASVVLFGMVLIPGLAMLGSVNNSPAPSKKIGPRLWRRSEARLHSVERRDQTVADIDPRCVKRVEPEAAGGSSAGVRPKRQPERPPRGSKRSSTAGAILSHSMSRNCPRLPDRQVCRLLRALSLLNSLLRRHAPAPPVVVVLIARAPTAERNAGVGSGKSEFLADDPSSAAVSTDPRQRP